MRFTQTRTHCLCSCLITLPILRLLVLLGAIVIPVCMINFAAVSMWLRSSVVCVRSACLPLPHLCC